MRRPYSLVVLDLGLPRRDGIEVLRSIRERRIGVPVLVMTARDTVRDRIKGSTPALTTISSSRLTSTNSLHGSVP